MFGCLSYAFSLFFICFRASNNFFSGANNVTMSNVLFSFFIYVFKLTILLTSLSIIALYLSFVSSYLSFLLAMSFINSFILFAIIVFLSTSVFNPLFLASVTILSISLNLFFCHFYPSW